MSIEQLAALQQAHHRRFLGLQEAAADSIGYAWDTYAGLDDLAAVQFEAAAGMLTETFGAKTSEIAVGYMKANDRLGGFPDVRELVPRLPQIRGGVSPAEVYHRSIVEARRMISTGSTFDEAMAAGRARAVSTARTDVSLANKAEVDRGGELRPWVVGYRRVLTGQSCAFCAVASTQRYRSARLMPLHPSCDCDVAEIFGTEDPGQVINRQLLDALKAEGVVDDITKARKAAARGGTRAAGPRNYVVDEQGAIRFRQTKKLYGPDGAPLRTESGEIRRRVTAGDRVRPEVVEHGELGPMLTNAKHATTTAANLQVPAAPLRTRAKVSDPDVLAEARRRSVSPERVVEIRNEQAERRYLEDRARRAAAKEITAESPEVVRLAGKYGVHPDEVISARARVADVRKIAREEAARVQAEALRELDRFDAVKLRNPPRKGSTTGTGRAARGGEWDWLEQVSDREKTRLSRSWYGGTQAPDQAVQTMASALGRDLSVDDGMRIWLDLNRRAEAAGALRRGRLPSLDGYSGQIDVDSLLARFTDDGYDAAKVFGDDLEAAAHIAQVEADIVRDEALQYLGNAARAVEGPSPYRMGFQTWEEELRDLERLVREGGATGRDRRRLAELVPEYLDDDGLDYEELYARIITTARRAGEEVPDYARIPWQ